MKKIKTGFITLLVLAISCLSISAQKSGRVNKPNILVIVADDLGNQDASYHNLQTEIMTPNIDKIAHDGVYFTTGYVTAPVCGPSRAGLLTGRYQQRFGFEDNPGPFRVDSEIEPGIPTTVSTIPELLKPLGYATGCIGKWHLGDSDEFFPTNRGFDEFYGFLGGASGYYVEDNSKLTIFRNTTPVDSANGYITDVFGSEAVKFIESHKQEPFFLYLAFNAVHGPLSAPDSILAKFSDVTPVERQTMCAMNYSMDKNIGFVMSKLEELGLDDNTLIIFLSDNGGKMEEGNFSFNAPYKGMKGQLYEGGIRLPFCIKWPGNITSGTVYDKPVVAMDILTTAMAAAGGTMPADETFDGVDLIPYIEGDNINNPHDNLFWRMGTNHWAVRDDCWKLELVNDTLQLYDILNDKEEAHNLVDQYPDQVSRLKELYDNWNSQMLPALWGWNPAVGDYIAHYEENFEHIVKSVFEPYQNSDWNYQFVNNPVKSGIDTSSTVLKITIPPNGDVNISGIVDFSKFQKRFRYLHIKVLKENISPFTVEIGLNDAAERVAITNNDQAKTGEWEDLVFDFDNYYSAMTKMVIYPNQQSYSSESIVYIDDIHFSDDPNQIGGLFELQKPNGFTHQFQQDGSVLVEWNPIFGSQYYKVFVDGVEVAQSSDNSVLFDNFDVNGIYRITVQAFDSSDNPSLLSDEYFLTMPDYVTYKLDFEGILPTINPNGSVTGGTVITEVIDNPDKSGINVSNKVLKIVRPNDLAKIYAGAYVGNNSGSDLDSFRIDTRYVHMKVYKQRITPVSFKILAITGENPDKFSINDQSTVGAWEDMVFDFNLIKGKLMKRMILRPDYEVGDYHEFYIDDIIFNNDPEPITGTPSAINVATGQTGSVFPNPASDKLFFKGIVSEKIFGLVYNMSGQLIEQFGADAIRNGLSLRNYTNGIYVLVLKDASGKSMFKFIKQ